jgi:hypothetical protein
VRWFGGHPAPALYVMEHGGMLWGLFQPAGSLLKEPWNGVGLSSWLAGEPW